ncbi:helix-turn-helix domain-containing protein [Kitasatospora sp. NPDC048365]|uniref:helix-turn-helix domain-containing protein n=1 Tax=Kitasatospora sp. NPDC048365 TaxID=3364050 RepID=UPI0037161E00
MLEALGVPEPEEELYRVLLGRPGRSLAELAEATGAEPTRLRRLLRGLESRGMVTRTPTRPVRFRPAPPDAALEVLALSLHQQVEQARLAAGELTALWRAAVADRDSPVEVVQGAEANLRCLLRAQLDAVEEVLILDRPPYVAEAGTREQAEVQLELMARGVGYRTVYDRAALEEPDQPATARRLGRSGERARVVDGLPMKLVVVDRRTALVPFVLGEEPQTVVLRDSPLLAGLLALFEAQWEAGAPLWSAGPPSDGLSEEDLQLLGFAAAGYTDELIAGKLGVNKRTVERRMRRLMDSLGARTRFQAGLQAGLRGHLG